MYEPNRKEYDLVKHLRVLFKFLNFFGLTGVKFNKGKRKFEQPRCNRKVTYYVYKSLKCFSGFLLLKFVLHLLLLYVSTKTFEAPNGVDAQEMMIAALCYYIRTTSMFIYASNYLRIRKKVLPLFNEVLQIFNKLKFRTGPRLFFTSKILKVLIVKSVILAFKLKYMLMTSILVLFMYQFVNFDFTFGPILSALMIFSYIYIQLTLLCFYEKMNDYLETFGGQMDERERVKCVQEFISISRRIHKVKWRMNGFSNSVFMSTYIGLFHDIEFIYLSFKGIFYAKYFSDYNNEWFHLDLHYFPAGLVFIFDMFIIGMLSDMLESANDRFQTHIVTLSKCMPFLERDVEMMLMRDNICGLELMAFGHIKVNQQFAFDFTLNIILVFVIMFLQFFAAEQIYVKDFKKVTTSDVYLTFL